MLHFTVQKLYTLPHFQMIIVLTISDVNPARFFAHARRKQLLDSAVYSATVMGAEVSGLGAKVTGSSKEVR